MRFRFLLIFLFAIVLVACPSSNQHPNHNPPPPPKTLGPLTVCQDHIHFCYEGKQVWLRGFSGYGAFSIPYDYAPFLDKLQASNINIMREWVAPYPTAWGGQQPYLFSTITTKSQDGKTKVEIVPKLNELFWQAADNFITLASQRNIWVLVDLTDRYGAEPKEFQTNPLNKINGGPLAQGLPNLYQDPAVLQMLTLGITRLSKHKNVIYQVCNEPSKASSPQELITFHKNVIAIIRKIHPPSDPRVVTINPVPSSPGSLPTLPLPQAVGADAATIHGAGVSTPKNRSSCSPAEVSKYFATLQSLFGTPILSDTDGLYAKNVPCHRYDDQVLLDLAKGAFSIAGFNTRGGEPGGDEPVKESSLLVLQGLTP